jgi:hypothetical protein
MSVSVGALVRPRAQRAVQRVRPHLEAEHRFEILALSAQVVTCVFLQVHDMREALYGSTAEAHEAVDSR